MTQDLKMRVEEVSNQMDRIRQHLILSCNFHPKSDESIEYLTNYALNHKGAEFIERRLGQQYAVMAPIMISIIKEFTEREERLVEALRFYANPRNYAIYFADPDINGAMNNKAKNILKELDTEMPK